MAKNLHVLAQPQETINARHQKSIAQGPLAQPQGKTQFHQGAWADTRHSGYRGAAQQDRSEAQEKTDAEDQVILGDREIKGDERISAAWFGAN